MAEPKAFVVGHPIAHSRSPLIHGYWLDRYGITGSYERIDVAPDRFADFVSAMPASGFAGGNVTIPHKEAACRLVGRLDEAAELIGAANTLWIEDGVVCGGNTDAAGFAASLDAAAPAWRSATSALVIGAGGASRAIVFALRQAGIAEIRLVNRTETRSRELADRFGERIRVHRWDEMDDLAGSSQLVVNTTALGMHGEGGVMVDVGRLPDAAIVADIVYVPLKTPLLAAAERRGLIAVDGLGMLLYQAAPGFERWFGRRPEVTPELRALIVRDLTG